MYKSQYFAFLLILSISFSAMARADRELIESKKCSNMFAYFEKRYNLPKDTLHSISLKETQKAHSKHGIGLVWPWTINVEGKGYHFASKDQAIKFAYAELAAGKTSIDIGCMQINIKHHPDAFNSIEQAFSPRRNIAYGAKFLKDTYNRLGSWTKTIGHYHSSLEERATNYQTSVAKISSSMRLYKQKLHKYNNPIKKSKYQPYV